MKSKSVQWSTALLIVATLALIALTGCQTLQPLLPAQPQPGQLQSPESSTPIPTPASASFSAIVDTTDPGFTIDAGDWGTCGLNDCGIVPYGPHFRYADPGCVSCRARFQIHVATTGNYVVYAWWPQGEDRATDAPFTLVSSAGSVTLHVDQRSNGNAWYLLKTLALQAGETLNVTVGGSATGFANADAIAVTPAGTGAPIGKPQPTPPAEARPTRGASPPPNTTARKIIFLHHSTGQALIEQGGVRERLTALGYAFYDHGYNDDGLVIADGTAAGANFNIPDDNTNPDGFAALFAQPVHSPPDNAFSHLLQYDVIAFKSCFPVNDIQSDDQLAEYQTFYRAVRAVMDQHRDKVFIVVTPPPLVPRATSREAAARARAFANWLNSSEYLAGHPNVFTFDFFDRLAENNSAASDYNMLRAAYRGGDPEDSHPNERANQAIGPQFADFIAQAIKTYSAK
jgi:hypothetical protein